MVKYRRRRPTAQDHPRVEEGAETGGLKRVDEFSARTGYEELVVARDIRFQSLCEHHMLPFHGVAHIGYLPDQRIVGLSKLARVVDRFARGLQVQERLTKQVADWLDSNLHPRGAGVVIEAEHQCMTLRGVRAHESRTITSALQGHLGHDAAARLEFFALTRR